MDDEFARHKKAYDNQEKLEAIHKLVTTYPMHLQDTIEEIQKILKK